MTSATREPAAAFVRSQRLAQGAFLSGAFPTYAGHGGSAYRLPPGQRLLNLAEIIRDKAHAYFADKVWHIHASHGLSSQACCLNFLMPLAERPDLLRQLVGGVLGFEPEAMLEVERGPGEVPWFVGFEWPGKANYLAEWPTDQVPSRGANVTCADAIVRFRGPDGNEALLIEWKYTEAYKGGLRNKVRPGAKQTPNEVRTGRYEGLLFGEQGPIRDDLGLRLSDFFYEPFYQLLRQQLLASAMERQREDGVRRVRVLHISPSGNAALHAVTSPKFKQMGHVDAFQAFGDALKPTPDGVPRFIGRTTEEVFGPLLAKAPDEPWAAYLVARYDFLAGGTTGPTF